MPNLIMLDGLRTDLMDVTDRASSDFVDMNNQDFKIGNPFIDPSSFYKVIINVNEVLANIDTISGRDRELTAQLLHQYKGALITLRSWTYFTLVRLYNQAYIIEDNLTTIPADLNQNFMDKNAVIDMLIEELLPYVHGTGITEGFPEKRFKNYMNTKALLGQLYLEKGNYTDAVYYLKLAGESYNNDAAILKVDGTYSLTAWESIFLNAASQTVENISVVPFSRAEAQFNPIGDWVDKDKQYMVKPSTVLVDSFMMQIQANGDTTDLYRGLEITFDMDTITQETYITKYSIDRLDPFSSDIIISRAADIHLLLAEAYNRLEDETSQDYAMMFLNNGVNSVSPKPIEYTRWSSNVGIRGRAFLAERVVPERDSIALEERTMIIEDLIMAERAMELAFEGKRWFDLVRVAERRNDPKWLADIVAAKFADDPAKYAEIHAKLMNPNNWYLPFE
jgi:hypothetical protein